MRRKPLSRILWLFIGICFIISCRIHEEPKELLRFKDKEISPISFQVEKGGLWRLVSDVGFHVVLPALENLKRETELLHGGISQQCRDIPQFDREKLKPLFLKAMRSYHFTEAFQIGFIARDGGELSKDLYSHRGANTYLIDKDVAKRQKNPSYSFKKNTYQVGFSSLEYLIYEDTLMNQCSSCGEGVLENWNRISREEKLESRCQYMLFVSHLLLEGVESLRQAWEPVEGDITLSETYRNDFKVVKKFASKLIHGMNFFSEQVKDYRLGVPSGINYDACGFDSCPDQSEHPMSKDSIYSLIYSARGLWAIFTGEPLGASREGYGFEEWLFESGHGDLVGRFKESLLSFIQNLEKLKDHTHLEALAQDVVYRECKETTVENRKVEICALYRDAEKVMNIYWSELLLAADFGRPVGQGGDTD